MQGSAAGLARRFGETKDAVAWGRRAVELEHTKLTAVWYAYALRADGQLDEALDVMRRGLAGATRSTSTCAPTCRAGWPLRTGSTRRSTSSRTRCASTRPTTAPCTPRTGCGSSATATRATSSRWRTSSAKQPVDSHQHYDLDQACNGHAWLGYVPAAAARPSPTCSGRWVRRHRVTGMRVALSALEVPSAIALVRRECPKISVSVPDPPRDMVVPIRPGPVLWRYDGSTAYPGGRPAAGRRGRAHRARSRRRRGRIRSMRTSGRGRSGGSA